MGPQPDYLPTVHIPCHCMDHTHYVAIYMEPDQPQSPGLYAIMLAFGLFEGPVTWWDRIKMAWRILTRKQYVSGEVYLYRDSLDLFIDALSVARARITVQEAKNRERAPREK